MKCATVALIAVLLVPVAALSQEFTGSVTYVATGGDYEVLNLPNGQLLSRGTFTEFLIADDPAWPLHLAVGECFDVIVGNEVHPDNPIWLVGDLEYSGFCSFVDKDGDVVWTWYQGEIGGSSSAGGSDKYLGGTGKYDGVEGGGTVKGAVEYPGANMWSGHWKGTIKLK